MGGPVTDAQLSALSDLAPALAGDFYLAGGVAVALRIGHRQSRDLDLFSTQRDPIELEQTLQQDVRATITSRAVGTLHLEVVGVPVSLLRYNYPMHAPEQDARIPVRVASIEDLICMKLSAIGGRGARRDFWDLHELFVKQGLTLESALALFAQKYPGIDVGHVVRATAYFGDADKEPMPADLGETRWASITNDFRRWTLQVGA